MNQRGSGILLHITSLPSRFGIGDFGPEAYRFVDLLSAAHQRYWQILPLTPTSPFLGNSPYSSFSAFAGNPLLISPELLVQEGFLEKEDIEGNEPFPPDQVDYEAVTQIKFDLLDKAFSRWQRAPKASRVYQKFCHDQGAWIDDYALFMALKEHFQGTPWIRWPQELVDREEESVSQFKRKLAPSMEKFLFQQFFFRSQWLKLKRYAKEKGVQIIGDIPIYVNYDSADVWAHTYIFKLDKNKKMEYVAGVPPDYFSKTGQRWGNPVYDWNQLRKDGFSWWLKRFEHNFFLYDIVRVDHFRGLVAYWEIPIQEETAVNGKWGEVPCDDFLHALKKRFHPLNVIAEDLGYLTPDVKEVMHRFGLPGMRILLFAFGGDLETHPYIPKNFVANCVAYTGTHDNNTLLGWYRHEANPHEKENLQVFLGGPIPQRNLHWELIGRLMDSRANTVIFPLQDILGLGVEARMNIPGTTQGNWQWRLTQHWPQAALLNKLRKWTEKSQRIQA